jgi:ATP-dependent RNA helicase DDX18/HAS1
MTPLTFCLISQGTGVIIIVPVRELALQIYGVAVELLKHNQQKTIALITGGTQKHLEEEKLGKGVTLIIATPGRLLDHMQHTDGFLFKVPNIGEIVN